MNIVTIDWDYLFPDVGAFDWGHSENNGLFYEWVWYTRPNSRALYGANVGKRAIDVVHVQQERLDYVKGLIKEWNPLLIYVAESHKLAFDVVSQLKMTKVDLWNLDAHHDTGYKGNGKTLKLEVASCENWVTCLKKAKKLKSYNLVYPEWRKDFKEDPTNGKIESIHYDFPKIPNPQVLFICRSPAWTPSWADNEWIALLKLLKGKPEFQESSALQDLVWKERQPNMEQAKKLAEQMDEHFHKFASIPEGN